MRERKNIKYSNSLTIQKRLVHGKNYNDWLFSFFQNRMGESVLEVGCGLGNFTNKLLDRRFVCAIDLEQEYVNELKESLKGRGAIEIIKCDISSDEILKIGSRFDAIICFNVLEHIENDEAALSNMRKLLKENGYLCLIAPAFQCLFGEMDRTDHHFRRYTKKNIEEKIKKADLKILQLKYINIPGFFGWWFNAKVLKRKYIPFRQMLMYDKLIPLVSRFERLIDPPIGQSLVLVARK